MKWLAENVRYPGMYATGKRSGKMQVVTRNEQDALIFFSLFDCQEWCSKQDNAWWLPAEVSK